MFATIKASPANVKLVPYKVPVPLIEPETIITSPTVALKVSRFKVPPLIIKLVDESALSMPRFNVAAEAIVVLPV